MVSCYTASPAPKRIAAHNDDVRSSVLTFVVESVDPVNTGALVVAAKQEEVLRILDLVGEQQANGLETLLAPIDVVALKR